MKRRVIGLIVLAIIIISGAIWYFGLRAAPQTASGIFASGFIEATSVSLASEMSGRIIAIAAAEGDQVNAGATLVRLDDSLLKAQQRQAEAGLQTARASLEQAQTFRDGAKKSWEDAQALQRDPQALNNQIVAAQSQLDVAQLNLDHFSGNFQPASPGYWGFTYETLLLQRDNARKVLDALLAMRDNPLDIKANVDQANSAYQTAAAAVKTVEGQVAQAEAALQVINVQLGKMAITSPVAGVVAARYAEPGEVAQPGAAILKIVQLAEVTLTAYAPESRIGLVKLGQTASVSVDSYPGQTFAGQVTFISPQAEFTPQNVQMKEEREKTVFAVKIKLSNPEQKLKPGMPADAIISIGQ